MSERIELTKEILEVISKESSDGMISKLMDCFKGFEDQTQIIIALLDTFGGTEIHLPRMDIIWDIYRNNIIYETLNKADLRHVREELARFFTISPREIERIYNNEKKKKRQSLSHGAVRRVVYSFVDELLEEEFKEMQELQKKKVNKKETE